MKKSKLISIFSAAVLASSWTASAIFSTASASDKSLSIGNTSLAFDISSSTDNVAASSYPKTTTGFVTRMYNVVLNRNPDSTGLNNWVKKLNNHTATAADIIDGFFFSDEYKGKKKSADEMVTDCYKAMLDRSPDSTGKTNWVNRLNVGMTMQCICKGFVGSDEFKGLCKTYGITPGTINLRLVKDESYDRTSFVYRLYKNCLGRNPDGSGLENWCKQIKNGKTGSSIASGFIFSTEYKNKHTTNYEFVDMMYRTILGREGDNNGMNSWTSKLNFSNTREYVFNGFLFSSEFKKQCSKAGINVGDKIKTKDDTIEWEYNVDVLYLINQKRASLGLNMYVTRQDIWENVTLPRAKDQFVYFSPSVLPNGKDDFDFIIDKICGNNVDSISVSRFASQNKYALSRDQVADFLLNESKIKTHLKNDNYTYFALGNSWDFSENNYSGYTDSYYVLLAQMEDIYGQEIRS